MWPTSKNTIATKPFRKNSARFLTATVLITMSVTCGDEESKRRYATQRLGVPLNRGLKPPATLATSLGDASVCRSAANEGSPAFEGRDHKDHHQPTVAARRLIGTVKTHSEEHGCPGFCDASAMLRTTRGLSPGQTLQYLHPV